jgi:hypothetical protein
VLYDVFIEVYHQAGNIVSYGRKKNAPIRLYFVNGNLYESVVPAEFEDEKQRQKISKKKHDDMPKTEKKKEKERQQKKIRKRTFDAKNEPKEKRSRCAFFYFKTTKHAFQLTKQPLKNNTIRRLIVLNKILFQF